METKEVLDEAGMIFQRTARPPQRTARSIPVSSLCTTGGSTKPLFRDAQNNLLMAQASLEIVIFPKAFHDLTNPRSTEVGQK